MTKLTKQDYNNTFKNTMRRYGWTDYVLSDSDLEQCRLVGLSPSNSYHGAYGVACDVNSGYTFEEALQAAIDDEGA